MPQDLRSAITKRAAAVVAEDAVRALQDQQLVLADEIDADRAAGRPVDDKLVELRRLADEEMRLLGITPEMVQRENEQIAGAERHMGQRP